MLNYEVFFNLTIPWLWLRHVGGQYCTFSFFLRESLHIHSSHSMPSNVTPSPNPQHKSCGRPLCLQLGAGPCILILVLFYKRELLYAEAKFPLLCLKLKYLLSSELTSELCIKGKLFWAYLPLFQFSALIIHFFFHFLEPNHYFGKGWRPHSFTLYLWRREDSLKYKNLEYHSHPNQKAGISRFNMEIILFRCNQLCY